MKTYRYADGEYEIKTEIKRSVFIASVKGEVDAQGAEDFVRAIRKKYPDATHNCYAYISDELGNVTRVSDDGEPSGTAGQPILDVLRKQNLVKTAIVVTRYFGGIKLGAGGLVRAYSGAVSSAIGLAGKVNFYPSDVYGISFNYDAYSHFLKFTQNNPITVLSTDFDQNVKVKIAVKKPSESVISAVNDLLIGKAEIDKISEGYYAYE